MKLRGRSSIRRRRRSVWGQQRSRPACSHQRGKLLAPQSATCVPLHGGLVGNPGRIWAYRREWRFQTALSPPTGWGHYLCGSFFDLRCGDEPLQQRKKKTCFSLHHAWRTNTKSTSCEDMSHAFYLTSRPRPKISKKAVTASHWAMQSCRKAQSTSAYPGASGCLLLTQWDGRHHAMRSVLPAPLTLLI